MVARTILFSFALAALLAVPVALLGACGPTAKTSEKAAPSPRADKPRQKSYEDKEGVSEKGKEWGGWRWQGKREDCFYTVKRKCFTKKVEACKAAGCSGKSCNADSSAPVKISCR